MPRPRRPLSLLVQDALGTVPIVTPHTARLERHAYAQRRCAQVDCGCVLARDNDGPYCSPCQRRIAGVPVTLSLNLPPP